jgi:branched-chain amino acid transport system permease protein
MRTFGSSWSRIAIAALLVLAVVLPWMLDPYSVTRVSALIQTSIAVLSLNLVMGLAGQISVGQATFVGVGAYTSTILTAQHGWNFWLACVAAILVSAGLGLVVGLPALRLRGLYVALTSLGIAIVFPTVVQAAESVTGGSVGLSLDPLPESPVGSLEVDQWIYYVSLAVMVVIFVLVRNLKQSRIGRALQAMRDQETVAESFGVRIAVTKLMVFTISAGIAGASGCLFALQNAFVSPSDFGLTASIDLFVGTAVGGQTSVFGAILGGGFLEYAPTVIADTGIDPILTPLVYGLILIAAMIFFRDGLAGLPRYVAGLVRRSRGAANGDADNEPTDAHHLAAVVDSAAGNEASAERR